MYTFIISFTANAYAYKYIVFSSVSGVGGKIYPEGVVQQRRWRCYIEPFGTKSSKEKVFSLQKSNCLKGASAWYM